MKMTSRYPDFLTDASVDRPHLEIVTWVGDFVRKKNFGPTTEEIAAGVRQPMQTVRLRVARLVVSGYLSRTEGVYRSLRRATPDEHRAALFLGWKLRISAMPEEERKAVIRAAISLGPAQDAQARGVGT
jgi:hypothetical protein